MKRLGFFGKILDLITIDPASEVEMARVIAQHRERYIIQNNEGSFQAEITGQLRFSAASSFDLPAVGDWVKVKLLGEDNAIIIQVFPRFSHIARQTPGKEIGFQIIATNIDVALIIQSVGQDFNLNRLERYLAICNQGIIAPMILLNKIDLIASQERQDLLERIRQRHSEIPVRAISCETGEGLSELQELMLPYHTYCILGSSGVGKSSLVNYLKGNEVMATKTVSAQTNKGKHTTSHRELFMLENQSLIIDTPGMREVGMAQSSGGISTTFQQIVDLANLCKFNNCQHHGEPGCAIEEAISSGELDAETYSNYQKLRREEDRFNTSRQEQRRKDKQQGKFYKSVIARKKKTREGD